MCVALGTGDKNRVTTDMETKELPRAICHERGGGEGRVKRGRCGKVGKRD